MTIAKPQRAEPLGARGLLVVVVLVGSTFGCGMPQSDICQRYIACQEYYDETFERSQTQVNRFHPDGVCWESEDTAEICNEDCEAQIIRLRQRLIDAEEAIGLCELPPGVEPL